MFSKIIQNIFFKGARALPKPVFKDRAGRLGNASLCEVTRNGGAIKVLTVSPVAGSTKCTCHCGAVVVMAHPISRKAKYFFTESVRAERYLQCGATVVAFDFNGFGESSVIDLFYWKDVAAVLGYVQASLPSSKIILHGTSFGAFHCIRAVPLLPKNSQVVLENVNKSLMSYWKRWPMTKHLVRAMQWIRVKPILDMNVQSVLKNLTREDICVVFIACEKDEMTTQQEMQELYQLVSVTQKRFEVFLDAAHLQAPAKDLKKYINCISMGKCQLC